MRTKQELDTRLASVTTPAPLIMVGPGFPIQTFHGYNDPQPGYYLGARVDWAAELQDECRVVEFTNSGGAECR